MNVFTKNFKQHQRFFLAVLAVAVIGGGVGVMIGLQQKKATELPNISSRAGETSPSTEFLNAQRSVDYLRKQIQLQPNTAKNYVELAQVFLQEARATGNHHEYVPKARTMLDIALRLAPNDFNALLTSASLNMTLHQFKTAKELATRCVAMNPYNAGGYGVLCDALTECGEYEQAVRTADTMTAKRPDLRSYSRVSYLRELHGDIAGAIEAMKLAANAGVRGQENRAWVLYNMGNLLLQMNRVAEAEYVFRGILEERPHYPFALGGLARLQAMNGDYFKAVEIFYDALHYSPEHVFLEQVADVYNAMNEKTTAAELQQQVLEAFAQHEREGWNVHHEYAAFCLNHNIKLQEALRRAEADYRERPNNIDALDVYAFALYKNGRAQEAAPLVEKMLRLGSVHPVLTYHAGLIMQAVGKQEEGARRIREAQASNLQAFTAYIREGKIGEELRAKKN